MLETGQRLSGRYRICSVLGKGGMGAVYLGCLESLGNKFVAIKEMVLPEGAGLDEEHAVKQFRREATFLAHLDHPNLVKVTDFFSENQKHYLVMDYVPGQTLQQMLESLQRPFTWDELKPWALQIVDVLHYLHSCNPPILFRDLKPANVMIDSAGRVKLIDFGIARTATPGMETSTFLKGTGTNGFSPIEQYGMGESTDGRSDIYSFGATLFYLLTGKLPPDAVSRVSRRAQLPHMNNLNQSLPSGLHEVVAKCLSVQPDDRYASASELKRNLIDFSSPPRSAVGASPLSTVPLETMVVSSQRAGSGTPWAIALTVLGLGVTATATLFMQNVTTILEREAESERQRVKVAAPVERTVYQPPPSFSTERPVPNVTRKENFPPPGEGWTTTPPEFLEDHPDLPKDGTVYYRVNKKVVKKTPRSPHQKVQVDKSSRRSIESKRVRAPKLFDEPSYPTAKKTQMESNDSRQAGGRLQDRARPVRLQRGHQKDRGDWLL